MLDLIVSLFAYPYILQKRFKNMFRGGISYQGNYAMGFDWIRAKP